MQSKRNLVSGFAVTFDSLFCEGWGITLFKNGQMNPWQRLNSKVSAGTSDICADNKAV